MFNVQFKSVTIPVQRKDLHKIKLNNANPTKIPSMFKRCKI